MAVVLRSWGSGVVVLAAGIVLAVVTWTGGSPGGAVTQLVLFAVLAAVFSPLVFPRSVSAAEAARAGKPIVYWRPGCQFCLRLRFALVGSARRASWVNIWADPEAAAAVRAVADGNETVPTVVVGGESRVNPSPRWVRERLAG
ncbi:glutaredoxin domain-containing protein [Kribbella sp.]|uniref:glutaredoxin domain-containing protein n=1 Tax=Kribbella sp. TaxID=1871183 RepID=UPI002D722A72|nr:glutaredoxin domain-containing protein [Kribbella sp.]HZX05360.1 glutaredoxin domain-containing protein [Kribbella sp.]